MITPSKNIISFSYDSPGKTRVNLQAPHQLVAGASVDIISNGRSVQVLSLSVGSSSLRTNVEATDHGFVVGDTVSLEVSSFLGNYTVISVVDSSNFEIEHVFSVTDTGTASRSGYYNGNYVVSSLDILNAGYFLIAKDFGGVESGAWQYSTARSSIEQSSLTSLVEKVNQHTSDLGDVRKLKTNHKTVVDAINDSLVFENKDYDGVISASQDVVELHIPNAEVLQNSVNLVEDFNGSVESDHIYKIGDDLYWSGVPVSSPGVGTLPDPKVWDTITPGKTLVSASRTSPPSPTDYVWVDAGDNLYIAGTPTNPTDPSMPFDGQVCIGTFTPESTSKLTVVGETHITGDLTVVGGLSATAGTNEISMTALDGVVVDSDSEMNGNLTLNGELLATAGTNVVSLDATNLEITSDVNVIGDVMLSGLGTNQIAFENSAGAVVGSSDFVWDDSTKKLNLVSNAIHTVYSNKLSSETSTSLEFQVADSTKWTVKTDGVLEATGNQTIQATGHLTIASTVAGSDVNLAAYDDLYFYTGNNLVTPKWTLDDAGTFYPGVSDGQNIGSISKNVGSIYVNTIRGGALLYLGNTTAGGNMWVIDPDGHFVPNVGNLDIGKASGTQIRNIYTTGLVAPTITATTLTNTPGSNLTIETKDEATDKALIFKTAGTQRWSILPSGILEATDSQTIRSSNGSLYLQATAGSLSLVSTTNAILFTVGATNWWGINSVGTLYSNGSQMIRAYTATDNVAADLTLDSYSGATTKGSRSINLAIDGVTKWQFQSSGLTVTPGNILFPAGSYVYTATGNMIMQGATHAYVMSSGGTYSWCFQNDGNLKLPDGDHFIFNSVGDLRVEANQSVQIRSLQGSYIWNFLSDGNMYLPGGKSIRTSTGDIALRAASNALVQSFGGTREWAFLSSGELTCPGQVSLNNTSGFSIRSNGSTGGGRVGCTNNFIETNESLGLISFYTFNGSGFTLRYTIDSSGKLSSLNSVMESTSNPFQIRTKFSHDIQLYTNDTGRWSVSGSNGDFSPWTTVQSMGAVNQIGVIHCASYVAFTGHHIYQCNEEINVGDAVRLSDTSDGLVVIEKCDTPYDKACIGIYHGLMISDDGLPADFTDSLDQLIEDGYSIASIAAVGDSRVKGGCQGFNVCDEGGPVLRGDLLTTSSIPGYLMKQSDDVMHGYTVAKSGANVSFDEDGKCSGVYGFIYCG